MTSGPGETSRPEETSRPGETPKHGEQIRKRIIITVLTALFAMALLVLVSRGGMCERYERKMERQRLMRDYLDSMRMESDRSKRRKGPKGAATDTTQRN